MAEKFAKVMTIVLGVLLGLPFFGLLIIAMWKLFLYSVAMVLLG